ncbi:MAG: methyltransferase domain-containing protein [Bacteroidetes bacterium]|nr:methyltransferase domain-containing protein [Bacteroidota bacterium]
MKNLLLPLFLFFTSLCFGQASLSSGDEHEKERARWNKSLVHDTAYRFNRNPNALLVQTEKGLKKGTALDIGMGQGRNSLFLAKQGWKVTGIDIADEAVHYALKQAKGNHVTIDARITPMEDFDFGTNRWDLIVHVYEGCLDGDNNKFGKIAEGLKPDGLLVFEFFHLEAGAKMGRPDFGCTEANTKSIVETSHRFDVVSYKEEESIADYSLKPYKVIKMVARKSK